MKKLKKLLLTVLVALVSYASAFAYDFSVNGIYYSVISDTEVAVNYGSNSSGSNVVIPERVNGYKVTEIISGPKNAVTVTLPNTIKKIHVYAFNSYKNLKSINLPSSLEYIGMGAFSFCTSLTSIEIPEKVTTILTQCFLGCTNLKNIVIPSTVKEIYNGAFGDCTYPERKTAWLDDQEDVVVINDILYICKNSDITGLAINEGVRSISENAFSNCPNLETITFPTSLEHIGSFAFNKTKWLAKQTLPLYVNNILVLSDKSSSFTVKEGTTCIAGNAFYQNYSLTSVSIPNSVKYIGRSAFASCTNLETISIPMSVREFGYSPFGGCSKLKSITVDSRNRSYKSIDGILYSFSCDSLIQFPGGKENSPYSQPIILSDKTRYICYGAFETATNLSKITIPKSVSWIDAFNFNDTSMPLSEIYIPSRVNTYGDELKFYTSSLTKVYNFSSISIYANKASKSTSLSVDAYLGNSSKQAYTSAAWINPNVNKPNSVVIVTDSRNTELQDYLPDSYFYKYLDTKTSTYYWKAKNYYLTDAEPFYCPKELIAEKINYTRNFKNTNWQALYLPFALNYNDWKDKAKIARVNNVHQYDDDDNGTIDRTIIEFISIKSGATEANTPYIIKPLEEGEMVLTTSNATIVATPATDGFVDCSSTANYFKISGNYQAKNNLYSKGCYALSGGAFLKVADEATLSPFRLYLDVSARTRAAGELSETIGISVDGVYQGTTDIEAIFMNDANSSDGLFDLNGIRVENLSQPGIYVRKGKLIYVK